MNDINININKDLISNQLGSAVINHLTMDLNKIKGSIQYKS